MPLRHVRLGGRHPRCERPRVLRSLMLPEVSGDQSITHMKLYRLTHILMRHRVKVMIVLHVVVDIDLGLLDINKLIGMGG